MTSVSSVPSNMYTLLIPSDSFFGSLASSVTQWALHPTVQEFFYLMVPCLGNWTSVCCLTLWGTISISACSFLKSSHLAALHRNKYINNTLIHKEIHKYPRKANLYLCHIVWYLYQKCGVLYEWGNNQDKTLDLRIILQYQISKFSFLDYLAITQ